MSSSLGISLSLPPYQMNRHCRPLICLIFSSNAPRNKDLTEMNIAIEFRIDQLQANGTYNVRRVKISLHGKRVSIKVTGWLGFEWIPLESQGQQPFTAALINGTLSPQVLIILIPRSGGSLFHYHHLSECRHCLLTSDILNKEFFTIMQPRYINRDTKSHKFLQRFSKDHDGRIMKCALFEIFWPN